MICKCLIFYFAAFLVIGIFSTSRTLDLTVKDLCTYCNRDKGGRTSCCGYNSWKKGLEIDVRKSVKLLKTFNDLTFYLKILREKTNTKNDLKLDLEKALFNESLSDFSFTLDNEKIPVCKIILSGKNSLKIILYFY